MSAAFETCLPFILREEMVVPEDWSSPRNYSVDPAPTMCGIEATEYNRYRKVQGIPPRSVRLITQAEAAWIYEHWYWEPVCPQLPSGLDLSFFDSAVNEGEEEAIRILQVALGVNEDGIWGPETAAAVVASPPAAAVKRFALRRKEVYQASRGFAKYGKDWEARADRIEIASYNLSQGAVA